MGKQRSILPHFPRTDFCESADSDLGAMNQVTRKKLVVIFAIVRNIIREICGRAGAANGFHRMQVS